MIAIVGVRFKKAGKIYYFAPGDLDLKKDDKVIVDTSRGQELGYIAFTMREIEGQELRKSLKKVIRIADNSEIEKFEQNKVDAKLALEKCKELAISHGLEMNLISSEYSLDRTKLLFSFTAEGRVDFRELVKSLAGEFRTRIELKQVGVRDEARGKKSIGPCGYKTCCSNWMGDFEPVSIKMAKEQNLSLNPVKISGVCGRLMCCLKYEYESYKEINKTLPNFNEIVETPLGNAVVLKTNTIKEEVSIRLFKGKKLEYENLESDTIIFKNSEIKRTRKYLERPKKEDEQ